MDTGTVGNGGNITIDSNSFLLRHGAFLDARTRNDSKGGNITVNTNIFQALNGGQLITNTSNNGAAGNITVNATKKVIISGSDIFARSTGSGIAGDIEVNSPKITLDNQGRLNAESELGNGGNINLNSNLLLLRRGSQISTTAGTAQAGGNGGSITIDTPFLIAFPQENSDITANAFSGQGGKVSINATGIFNIAPLSLQDLRRLRPSDLDPRQLPTNDITAISQQNADLSGTVQINTPDIDPSRGLITLPTVTENTPKPISSSCAAFNELAGGSNFTITGRGGLPPSPDQPLTSDVVWSDTRLPTTTQHKHKTHPAKSKPEPIEIVPATGWVFNGKGEVTLISSATNATTVNTPTSCPAW